MRIGHFKELVANGFVDQELRLRNNSRIRVLFAEIMFVLCESLKKHCVTEVKVKKEDFDLTQMTERFKAPHVQFATRHDDNNEEILSVEDPRELFIAANELAFSITEEGHNAVSACYWVEWMMEFVQMKKLVGEPLRCARRSFIPVDPRLQMDAVWIIWDLFLEEAKKRTPLFQRIVDSALHLYCLKHRGYNKKKKWILYFVIEVLASPTPLPEEAIVKDKDRLALVCRNVHRIYEQVKRNEHSPGTDYLYFGLQSSSNLESTIAKLETMNSLAFIPRQEGGI